MQVRRFEARSMKEALEMVKSELGPEAIILSARDNSRRFGLIGDGSVEITAAVSDETLKRRKALESRMKKDQWENFRQSSARRQKEALEKAFRAKENERVRKGQLRYIDIEDEGDNTEMNSEPTPTMAEATKAFRALVPPKSKVAFEEEPAEENHESMSYPANARVKAAAAQAWKSLKESSRELEEKVSERKSQANDGQSTRAKDEEISSLKKEINDLKQILVQFQQGSTSKMKSSYPGYDYGLSFDVSFLFEQLTESVGILPEYAAEILSETEETLPKLKLKKKALVNAFVANKIYEEVKVVESSNEPRVNIYFGARGSGKTSSLIKQASHWALQGKKVAILTTDTVKVGAIDQLRIYTQILNIPFGVLRDPEDWLIAEKELAGIDHILIDFPGMSLKQPEEMHFLFKMLPPNSSPSTRAKHLVISATKKDGDIAEVTQRYSQIGIDDVIFTCLDEVTQHGVIYNFHKRFGIPLHSFGIGPRVPEDLERATKERVVDLIFKLTQSQERRDK